MLGLKVFVLGMLVFEIFIGVVYISNTYYKSTYTSTVKYLEI